MYMKKIQGTLSANRRGGESAVKHSALARVLSFALALVIALSAVSISVSAEQSAEVTKVKRRYEIAVVFDNSGSMYKTQAWCQAKYAMEIFASMLNYDDDSGDKLSVFPMWEVATDGKKPSAKTSVENTGSIQIKSQGDIEKISNMHTLNAGDTPITQVDKAYNYLMGITDETVTDKWLIVLTDGAFTNPDGSEMESSVVRKHLLSKAANGIKVQYLGFGSAATIQSDVFKDFYTKTSKASTLRKDLIDICNSIFQRSKLPESYLNGDSLKLDISMAKIIVFVQGKDAEIVSLEQNGTGNQIKKITDSGKIKYSTFGAADYPNAPYDDSLYGQVVTFDACSAGEYTLKYKGATNVEIFYEPDVNIKISMKRDGVELDPEKDPLYPGEYTFEYSVVDNKDPEKVVTESPLVDVQSLGCVLEITNNGKTKNIKDYKSGAPVELEAEDTVFFNISGTYLTDYTITTKDNQEGFTIDIERFPQVPEFEIDVDVLQEDNWYTLKEREEWKPIKVSFTVGEQPLTDEQAARVASTVVIEPELPFTYEILPGESAIAVYIAKDENGKDTEPAPEPGSYEIAVEAFYTDENGQISNKDDEDASFRIEEFSPWIIKLIGLAVIAGLLFAAFLISRIPTYPKKVAIQRKVGETWTPRGGKKLSVKNSISARIDGVTVFSGKTSKSAPLSKRSKQSSSFTVKVTQIMSGVDSMKIGSTAIVPGKDTEVEIRNGTMIKAEKDGQTKVYRIIINPGRRNH